MFEVLSDNDPRQTVIKVVGVGGGGGNAVEHMIERGAQGIEFIAINTDYTALSHSRAHATLQIGKTGLGAGARPEVGEQAAIEAKDRIRELLQGANLVFITAGMGGGTGTGAAPVVAQIAREMGILTVAVVTKPFSYEGALRMQRAEEGLVKLKQCVDSQIVILNDKLEDELGEDASVSECFAAADDVLFKACAGITEIIQTPGLIGVDFEDLRTVMSERGTAMMGSAIASGPDRARIAAENAVACPLLEGVTLNGARGVLVYITASEESMKMKETKTVMNIITNFTAKGAQVIYGSAYDDSMGDSMRVTVVATGLDGGKDKEVAPIDKPAEKQDVWKHNDRTFTETKETDPWAPRQTQQAAAKVTQAQPEQTQQSVLSEPKPVTLDPVQPEPQPQPVQQPQTEPEKEEKAADEWETGWWSIRHDTK
ncbi:MAG TPA: cell division protein FtsZ [Candidatus Aphodousia faecigallinarum]|uniref:Cell division protein FtsZ n=1 Tax=Candidatus Aphodousia faecigallinarum TaxID=2840677 RepID=A0A9D1IIA8_9BURK|nr:cell division protein FtsZ [Candidatus Aphodousia faecigallinarum]